MNEIITDVNWLAVVVSAILSFMLGALWYSPLMFGKKWAEGVGMDLSGDTPMKPPASAMVVQMLGSCHCRRWKCQLGNISLLDRGRDVNAADSMDGGT